MKLEKSVGALHDKNGIRMLAKVNLSIVTC